MALVVISANVYSSLFAQIFTRAGWEVFFLSPAELTAGEIPPNVHPDLWLHARPCLMPEEVAAHPLAAFTQHTAPILQVLSLAQQSKCSRLIFISSARGVTKAGQTLPPQTASLAMAEEIITYAPLHSIILRPGQIIGAPTDAFSPYNEMQSMAATLLGQQPEFLLAGTDYPTPDGTVVRDLIHLADFGQAIILASEFLRGQSPPPDHATSGAAHYTHHAFHLGQGIGFSVREMMGAMETVAQKKLPYRCGPRRPDEISWPILPGQDAAQVLGWVPRPYSLLALAHTALAAQSTKAII